MVRLSRLAIVASVLCANGPRAAYAQASPAAPSVRISLTRLEGAESCADEASLARELVARLGRDYRDANAARSVEITVSREAARWRAVIVVREAPEAPEARRELVTQGASCAELDASVALAVALFVDPAADVRAARATQRSDGATTTTTTTTTSAPPPEDAWNRGEAFVVEGGVAVGSVPASAVVGVAFEGARWRFLRPYVAASRTIEARMFDPASGLASFGFSRTRFAAGVCFGVANGRFSVDGCPAVWAGMITSVLYDTRTFEPVRPGDYPWLALAVSARGSVRIWGPVAFELGAAPSVALLRQRFSIEGLSPVLFEQSVVGLDAWAAIRARFW
ncbi:MAG: hypothetical protein JNK05_01820 [Myxococcales bacterium]|nr:hypothetical protein [Myxococcales bacterium]